MSQTRTPPLLDAETLKSRTAALVRQYIIDLREGYEPGSRLNPRKMARQFGISETPLKMALQELTASGLVEVLARRGTFVCRLSRRDIDELIDVRAGLECMALRMVGARFPTEIPQQMLHSVSECEHALKQDDTERYRHHDGRFHELIVEASGNRRLKQVYESLTGSVQILSVYNPRHLAQQVESQQEHRQLAEAFGAGASPEWEEALALHWQRSKQRLINAYSDYLSAREEPSAAGHQIHADEPESGTR